MLLSTSEASVSDAVRFGDGERARPLSDAQRRRRPHARLDARHAAIALAAATSVLLLGEFEGPMIAALFAVSLAVFPGVFVVDATMPRGPIERLVIIWTTSLTFWIVVAHLMLSVQWWEPSLVAGALLAGCAGVGVLCLLPNDSAASTSTSEPRRWVDLSLRSVASKLGRNQLIATAVTIALWLGSLPFVDVDDIGDWGLIDAVPPTWLFAFALAVIVATTAALATHTSVTRVALAIAPLLAIVYATHPLLVDTIRYPWAYKHVGVIRLLDETGRLHTHVDIYNNFSGFFGLGALLRGASGVDPVSYAAWTQFVAEALILCAVWLLVRRATDSERVAHLAAVLYLITNWVGQNYFAAQTMATLFGVTVLGLMTSWFLGGRTRAPRRLRRTLTGLAPRPDVPPPSALRARRLCVLTVFLGLMMSHPLTPAAILGAITLAWIVGWMRDRVVLVGVYVIAVGWLVRSIGYFAAQSFDLGFGGSPTANADGNLDYSAAPDVVVTVGNLTRLFSVTTWLFALLGALACAWAMRRTGMLIVAAVIPFGIPLVQSYGGEAIYRVYLYSLPLIVAFIAWGIVTQVPITRSTRSWIHTSLACCVTLLLGAGFLIAHFGRERINQVDASEVAMGDYIAANVADPALLAQFDGTYPAASSARYPSFQVNDTYVPEVVDLLGASPVLPQPEELDDVADDLIALDAGTPYVIVSPGMIDSVQQVGSLPVDSTADAVALLTTSDRFVVRHRIDDTWLVEVLP